MYDGVLGQLHTAICIPCSHAMKETAKIIGSYVINELCSYSQFSWARIASSGTDGPRLQVSSCGTFGEYELWITL
jgi:hypothetical protein